MVCDNYAYIFSYKKRENSLMTAAVKLESSRLGMCHLMNSYIGLYAQGYQQMIHQQENENFCTHAEISTFITRQMSLPSAEFQAT